MSQVSRDREMTVLPDLINVKETSEDGRVYRSRSW